MFRKILFFSLALFLIGGVMKVTTGSKPALASPVTIDKTIEQHILDSTLRITLYAPLTDAQGNPQYVLENGQQVMQLAVNEGLGTLTRQGGDPLIVTHDHWPLLTPDLRRVQFHNVANDLLLDLSGEQFLQLVRYRDGGTMVLAAPQELATGRASISLGDSRSAGKNDTVYLAHRSQGGGISVAAMVVQKETTYKGQPVFRLSSLNGEVVLEGNSGGGIVAGGLLIGNMWGTVLVEDVSGPGAHSLQQTAFSLAAQLPREMSAN
ncbi:MAG: hypothetical protein ACK2UF_12895 [Candidatus Promineifilaceae bacterium]|jgi:hypothetical protein